jgi:hypothetical protein
LGLVALPPELPKLRAYEGLRHGLGLTKLQYPQRCLKTYNTPSEKEMRWSNLLRANEKEEDAK